MGITRQYILNINVEDESDVEEMEALLQEILLDLYNVDSVQSIHVIDNNGPVDDEDLLELTEVLERLTSKDVMSSIEIARELEDIDG